MTRSKKRKEIYALTSLISAVFLTLAKLIAAVLTNSLAVWSEVLDSALDVINTSMGFGAVRISSKPPDFDHTYGHGKFESLVAYTETIFIFSVGLYIVYEAISRLFSVQKLYFVTKSMWLLLLTLLADLGLVILNYEGFRKTRSQVLKANYLNFLGDTFRTLIVIFSLVISQLVSTLFDSVFSILLAFFLIKEGFKLLKEATAVLLDRAPEGIIGEVEKLALHIKEVKEVCRVRARKVGDDVYIDLIVRLAPVRSLYEAHEIADEIEKKIKEKIKNADVVVHIEPAEH
ncbi:MAG: hypothetical protein DRJ38_08625 [Thermoprotei archaeon]|nr:MAG: hypothetical protein DRJ38_08625 [Thermoprotei archaeon]